MTEVFLQWGKYFLKNKRLSKKITNYKTLANLLDMTFKKKSNPKKISQNLYLIGNKQIIQTLLVIIMIKKQTLK